MPDTYPQLDKSMCPICNSDHISHFLDLHGLPVHCNILHTTQKEARNAARADIHLAFCSTCGHIFNRSFNPKLLSYGNNYENSLGFSKKFQEYVKLLARQLVNTYNLFDKRIIEIGSGDGQFLLELCGLGRNHGIGFDPSLIQERMAQPVRGKIDFIVDFYSEKYAEYSADLFCCRQVLEHIETPVEFLKKIRNAVGDKQQTTLFFEVPNVMFIIDQMSVWDIIYEHSSYFSTFSINRLFSATGFDILSLYETYDNQFLCIDVVPIKHNGGGDNDEKNGDEKFKLFSDQVGGFQERFEILVKHWHNQLKTYLNDGKKVIVWGAGSKGVSFLNLLEINEGITCIVDINPHKQGKFIAGTGHKIISPEDLNNLNPDIIIAMNAIYLDEIEEKVKQVGVNSELITV